MIGLDCPKRHGGGVPFPGGCGGVSDSLGVFCLRVPNRGEFSCDYGDGLREPRIRGMSGQILFHGCLAGLRPFQVSLQIGDPADVSLMLTFGLRDPPVERLGLSLLFAQPHVEVADLLDDLPFPLLPNARFVQCRFGGAFPGQRLGEGRLLCRER